MKKISVRIAGRHATSICLEEEFWQELKNISRTYNRSINDLVTQIDQDKKVINLSSAIRLYILQYLKSQIITSEKLTD